MAKERREQKRSTEQQWAVNPINEQVLDYRVYVMNGTEKIMYSLLAFACGGMAGLLFYGGLFKKDGVPTIMTYLANLSVFVMIGLVAVAIFLPMRRRQLLRKRTKDLRAQFRDMLSSLTASLSAGNTVLDSFFHAQKDMENQYGNTAYISTELDTIVRAARNNIDLETMVEDLAKRSGIEDIEDFANVFRVARGPGGNISSVMRQTHDIIGEKMAIEDEIASKMHSNEMELNVIMVAPIFIIAFLRFSSGTFSENFSKPSGVLATTVGLALFALAYIMGRKIVTSVR